MTVLSRRGFLGAALSAAAASLLVPRRTFFIGSMWRSQFMYEVSREDVAALTPREREDLQLGVVDWLVRHKERPPRLWIPLRRHGNRSVEWWGCDSGLPDPSRDLCIAVPVIRKEIRC